MKIFFPSRTAQRAFKSEAVKKVDNGSSAGAKRWAVELVNVKKVN